MAVLNSIPLLVDVLHAISSVRLSSRAVSVGSAAGTPALPLSFSGALHASSVFFSTGLFTGVVSLPTRSTTVTNATGALQDGGRTLVLTFDEALDPGEPVDISFSARDAQNRFLTVSELRRFAP